jgi:uncharacterized membrane protein
MDASGTQLVGSYLFNGNNSDTAAAIWTEDSDWQSLGNLDGNTCDTESGGSGISADGSVAVGLGWDNQCNGVAVRWTEEDGMQGLEWLGIGSNRAWVVSGDGAVAGGFAQVEGYARTPAIWTDSGGILIDENSGGEVYAINEDGSVVGGEINSQAFLWTEGDGVTLLPAVIVPPEPGSSAIVHDICGPGSSLAVGRGGGTGFFGPPPQAFAYTEELQTVDLVEALTDAGLTIPGEVTAINVARACSADGLTIVGDALVGEFETRAFIATVPPGTWSAP